MASDAPPPAPPAEEDEEKKSVFDQYYGLLTHQQNMLLDSTRTSTYQSAMASNAQDFEGKVVLDVGTGTGILAFFAVQAGARKVYAVECSDMAEMARDLVRANGMEGRIEVIRGKIESVQLPEKVDIVISEPMGFALVHERMLESFVMGRELWMRPGGLMFPSVGVIKVAPFVDEQLYQEQLARASFWQDQNFYGVDLSALYRHGVHDHFSQPVIGYFNSSILLSRQYATHHVDFQTIAPDGLEGFTIPFSFPVERTSLLHGLAVWFDVSFNGSNVHMPLATGPDDPPTHWYQCRFLVPSPLAVNATQVVSGSLVFEANDKSSYDIDMTLRLEGTDFEARQHIELHNQYYHYMTGGGES